MAAAKTGFHQGRFVNERQLFHGTSPENVEAICKQNFDWCLPRWVLHDWPVQLSNTTVKGAFEPSK